MSETIRYSLDGGITRWIDVHEKEIIAYGCYGGYDQQYQTDIHWEGPDRTLREYIERLKEEGKVK